MYKSYSGCGPVIGHGDQFSLYLAYTMHSLTNLVAAAAAVGGVAAQEFNVLQHIGGNGQWFPGSLHSIITNFIH